MKLLIRKEQANDKNAIHAVEEAAFNRRGEADLVDRMRDAGAVTLSLVAKKGDQLVGHVLFSPVQMDPPNPTKKIAALGPIAVAPGFQRQGIGGQLIEEGKKILKNLGWDAIVLIGDPAYYYRFGYLSSSKFNLSCTYPVPPDVFQILELKKGSLDACRGVVHFNPLFDEVT